MQVKVECMQWTSLGATMSSSTGQIQVTMKNRVCLQDPANKRVVRYPNIHVPNTPQVLQSLTPMLVIDGCFCHMPVSASHNLHAMMCLFFRKGYPTAWWRRHALRGLNTYGRSNPLPQWAQHMGSTWRQTLSNQIRSW